MSRYFFDIKNGHRLVDPSGIDCESDGDATIKAKIIAAEVAKETGHGGRRIAIVNDEGREVCTVPVLSKVLDE